MRIAGFRRRGFTLVEVLVALAIMVILFALLFAPMMASLEWVQVGRANVNMQDAVRYAMELVRRELGEAVYVYPSPGYDFRGPDSTLHTGDDIRVPNYSQALFSPPARDSQNRVIHPLRAATDPVSGLKQVIRYTVKQIDPSAEYSDYNPFILYRQEFLWDATNGLGSYDSTAVWQSGVPVMENALTPKRGATFVPSATIGLDNADAPVVVDGYATQITGHPNLMYLFDDLRFEPQRVVGEQLQTDNGVVYTAKHGGWDGTTVGYYGTEFMSPASMLRSSLDPVVSLYQWDPTTGSYAAARWNMDSRTDTTPAARPVKARWSSDGGVLTCGQQARQDLGGGNIVYYKRISMSTVPNGNGWYTIGAPAEIASVYAGSTTGPAQDSGNAPISYRVDASADASGLGPVIVEPGTIKVRVFADYGGGQQRQIELKPTSNFDQASIKGDEYCVQLYRQDYGGDGVPDGTCAMLRFSRYDPPRPTSVALFGQSPPVPNSFAIHVLYFYRRNFVYDAARDAAGQDPFVSDLVKADYSTRTIQNVSLTLQRYTDLEETAVGSNVYFVPTDENPPQVSVREQVLTRNFGR